MLLDSNFVTELNTPQAAQTLAFVKKVLAGLLYVDIQVSGSTLTCQIKSGDGVNHNATTNVMLRVAMSDVSVPPAPPAVPAVSASVGTLKCGAGTNIFWIQTTSSGAFTVNVTGTGSLLIEATPNQGVAMSVGIG